MNRRLPPFAKLRPDLAKDWHPTKSRSWTPELPILAGPDPTSPHPRLRLFIRCSAAPAAARWASPIGGGVNADADRVAFLFERYLELTQAPLETALEKPKAKKRRAAAD